MLDHCNNAIDIYQPIERIKKAEERKVKLKHLKYNKELEVDFGEIHQKQSDIDDEDLKDDVSKDAPSVQKVRNNL